MGEKARSLQKGWGLSKPPPTPVPKKWKSMDYYEFLSFCKEYGLGGEQESLLSEKHIRDAFHAYCKTDKGRRLTADEFNACARQLEDDAQALQQKWESGEMKSPPAAVIRQAEKLNKHVNSVGSPRPTPLFKGQGLPLPEPVLWKKSLRDLMDETQRYADESSRMLTKANEFVAEHHAMNEEGRSRYVRLSNAR